MNTHTQTPPSVFGPAARHRLQLLFVNFESRRGCFTKLDSFSSWGLFFSIAQLLILMAALKSRFMNAMRSLPLFELTSARIPRTRALSAIYRSVCYMHFLSTGPFFAFSVSRLSEAYNRAHALIFLIATHFFIPLGEGLSGGRGICGRKTTCVPV